MVFKGAFKVISEQILLYLSIPQNKLKDWLILVLIS